MKGYTIKRNESGRLMVCKILNIYDASEEKLALEVLSKLATNKITEEELLWELRQKDITK